MRIWIRPVAKSGASAARFALYRDSATIGEYRIKNHGPFSAKDLTWDLRHGNTWLLPDALTHACTEQAPWDRWGPQQAVSTTYVGATSTIHKWVPEPVPPVTVEQQVAELRRIEALDEQPTIVAGAFERDPKDWTARGTPRYLACAARVRAAVMSDEEDRSKRAPVWHPEDAGEAPFSEAFDLTPAAIGLSMQCEVAPTVVAATRAKAPPEGTDPRLIPPISVAAARRRADFRAPHGWHAAMSKEVKRVEDFGAWTLVRYREYREMSRLYPGRVSIG